MPSNSPFVESRVDLFDRDETVELARRLGCSQVTAVGHLHALWHHCMKQAASDGDLSQYTATELAAAARWEGDAEVLREALFEGEWIEPNGCVHNWVLYYGKLGERRSATGERQRKFREAQRGFTDQDVWSRDAGRCRLCGSSVSLRAIHVTWQVPLKRGGEMRLDNALTSCNRCVHRKWGRLPEEAGLTVLGLLDEAEVSLTRYRNSPSSVREALAKPTEGVREALAKPPEDSLTRYRNGDSLTRYQSGADGSGVDGAAAPYTEPVSLTRYRNPGEDSLTRYRMSEDASPEDQKLNVVMNGQNLNNVQNGHLKNLNVVTILGASDVHNIVQISGDAETGGETAQEAPQGDAETFANALANPKPPPTPPGTYVNTGSKYLNTPEHVHALTGGCRGGDSDDGDSLTRDADPPTAPAEPVEQASAGSKRVGKKAPTSEQQQAVERLFERYKARIQPKARLCPTDKILARLAHFSEDELAQGIEHFAAEQWWMDHCAYRGATWFFEKDARSEQFLLLGTREQRSSSGRTAAHPGQAEWVADLERDAHSIQRRTLVPNDDSHTPPAPSEDPPMIGASHAAAPDDSDVAF